MVAARSAPLLQVQAVAVDAGWSWSRALFVWRWRGSVLLLRLLGMDCCSGWPPAPSATWTAYATTLLLVLTSAKLGVTYFLPATSDKLLGENKFLSTLFVVDVLFKNAAVALVQVLLIVGRARLALLSRAVLHYLSACPPSERSWRGMLAAGAAVSLITLSLPIIVATMATEDIWQDHEGSVLSFGADLLPITVFGLIEDSFFAVMLAGVFGTAEVADAVQEEADRLLRCGAGTGLPGPRLRRRRTDGLASLALDPVGNMLRPLDSADVAMAVRRDKDLDVPEALAAARAAGALRALRVRQQLLHDVVLASNTAFAWPNFCWILITVIETCVSVFLALAIYRGGVRNVPAESTIAFGANLSVRFCLNCVLGQRLCYHSWRICTILEGLLTRNPDVPAGVRVEASGFTHQVQMQDNRFGLFSLVYFDMNTMSAVLSSILTYFIVIIQFESSGKKYDEYSE